jgi:hypothetical protein
MMGLAMDKIHDGLYELRRNLVKFDTPETNPDAYALMDELNRELLRRVRKLRLMYNVPYDLRVQGEGNKDA